MVTAMFALRVGLLIKKKNKYKIDLKKIKWLTNYINTKDTIT